MSLDANRRPSLSSFQFLVYVSGGFAMNLTNLVLSQWLYERFVIGGIVSTAAFSLILLAGRLTDGISDQLYALGTANSFFGFSYLAVSHCVLLALVSSRKSTGDDADHLCGRGLSGLLLTLRFGGYALSRAATGDR
jgi:hypothetical protein